MTDPIRLLIMAGAVGVAIVCLKIVFALLESIGTARKG